MDNNFMDLLYMLAVIGAVLLGIVMITGMFVLPIYIFNLLGS